MINDTGGLTDRVSRRRLVDIHPPTARRER
jgi:hypothetical protein